MKRQRNNRLIALMLTMILLFSSVAGNVFALDLADAAMSEQANTPIQEPISQDAINTWCDTCYAEINNA